LLGFFERTIIKGNNVIPCIFFNGTPFINIILSGRGRP